MAFSTKKGKIIIFNNMIYYVETTPFNVHVSEFKFI